MQGLQKLLTCFSLLSFAALDNCVPTLNISQQPVGGSRAASIALPSGCRCDRQKLLMCVIGNRQPCETPCENRTMRKCTWTKYMDMSPSANHSLVLEGWYRTKVSRCRCGSDSNCEKVKSTGDQAMCFVRGLQLHQWNATFSWELLAGDRLSVQVVRQFSADPGAGRVFFPRIHIMLYKDKGSGLEFIKSSAVNCSEGDERRPAETDGRCSVTEFDGVLPGRYELGFAPFVRKERDFTEVLAVTSRRRRVKVTAIHYAVPATLADGHGRESLLPLLLPLLILLLTFLLALALLTWWMRGRRARTDLASTDVGTVLLLPAHNRAPELDTIKVHLRKLGVRTRDFQEWDMFRVFQSQPCVAAVLELPALREARIVFVCAGRDAPPLRAPAAELWDDVRRFVRNWRPTELVVLTTAGDPGTETAGLAAARAFAVPEDLDAMVQYLRETKSRGSSLPLPPANVQTTGVVCDETEQQRVVAVSSV